MAELIPLEYRISTARKGLIRRWIITGALAVVVCAAAVTYAGLWKGKQKTAYDTMQRDYREGAAILGQARGLQASRVELAARMARIGQLENDTVLLTLLKNVASSLSDDDCLKFINVDAHVGDPKSDGNKYQVQIHGITRDDTSHAALLDRLTDIGKKSQPPLKVNLGEKRLVQFLDGEATSFDLTCEPLRRSSAVAQGR
jgi:hypothetical protein